MWVIHLSTLTYLTLKLNVLGAVNWLPAAAAARGVNVEADRHAAGTLKGTKRRLKDYKRLRLKDYKGLGSYVL